MLEIIGIILLCRINKKNALALGKSGGGAIALTIGLWVGLEFMGAMIGSAAEMGLGSYVLALIFAAIGGAISYSAAKKPSKRPGAPQAAAGQYDRARGQMPPGQAPRGYEPQADGYAAANPYTGASPQNRFCVRCGQPLTAGAMYCGTCGAPVKPLAQQISPQPAAPVSPKAPAASTAPAASVSPKAADAAAPPESAAPAVPAAQSAAPAQRDIFYVFAVQGPAFGMAGGGDIVMEKAQKLKDSYAPAKDLEMKIVRPGQWNASLESGNSGGMISVSYNFANFKAKIREYLLKEGLPGETVENGIKLSEENSLQLSNPMSGIYVMGIPLASGNTPDADVPPEVPAVSPVPAAPPEAPAVSPVPAVPPSGMPAGESVPPSGTTVGAGESVPPPAPPCLHEYKHFSCVKCGEKAPKPQLASQGIRKQNQHTYEDYRAQTAEEAKYFLEQTDVTQPLYYVMVHTPEGDWGKDKDGIFLSRLCAFQHDLSLRQCDAETALVPERMSDLQMAANKITDNYTLSVTCGQCGHHWIDGVGYRTKTVVRCPECGKYNLADTEQIRFHNL